MAKKSALIGDLVEPTIQALGLQLWGVEHVSQGKYSTLRIYIESEEGITIDDCEKVSREISALLDVEEPISGEYTLEVSSPGVDRMLFTENQFEQFVGSVANVKTRTPIEGRRKFRGIIEKVSGKTISLQVDDQLFDIDHSDIEKANLVYQ